MKFIPKRLTQTADNSRGHFDAKDALKGSLLVIATLIGLYLAISASAHYLAENISDGFETNWLAKPYTMAFDTEEDSPPVPQHGADIFKRLTETPTLRDLNYRLVLIDTPLPNAFAFPGGGVGVTSGLFDLVESEAGLAFVLAHELAHHQKRHVLKKFWRSILWSTLLELGGLSGAERVLIFSESHYSREMEKEADLYALQLLLPLYGDNTDDYPEFFNKLLEQEEYGREQLTGDWLSTHPDLRKRVKYIKDALSAKPSP